MGLNFVYFYFQFSGKILLVAAILANICLKKSQADLGLDAA